jgi:hypothetical protein
MAGLIGRARVPEPAPTGDTLQLAQLRAAVDQVLTLVADAALTHGNNRQLVDLACDVRNTLRPQPRRVSFVPDGGGP